MMTHLELLSQPALRWFEENRKLFFRVSITSTVILAVVILAPRIALGNRNPTFLFLLYLLLAVSIVFLRWPVLGLISILLGGMFVHYVGPSGLNAAMGVVALMLVLWVMKMVIEQRKIQIIVSRRTIPLFLFILASIFSFGIGQLPWILHANRAPMDAQLAGLSIFILSAGAFLLVAHLVQELRWLKALTWTFIALGTFYIIGRLFEGGYIDRIIHHGFSAGSMFWTWFVALTLSQVVINRNLRPKWRVILGAIVLVTFYVAFVQGFTWKAGWFPPLVAAGVIVGLKFGKRALLLVPIGLIPAYNWINSLINADLYSWGTRIDAWVIVINMVKANPIFGLGFANYYWITPLFPIRGYAISFNSHSQYIDILAQTGLIGLVCFLWFLWEVGRLGWRMRERIPDGFPRAYVYGILGGLAGTLVSAFLVDWVLPFVYNIGLTGFRASVIPWLFLGGLVSLRQIYPAETSSN